jgi:hypothetical protein
VFKPDNDCQRCDLAVSATDWTNVEPNAACGPNDDQFCCNGICCPPSWCCGSDGICTRCECDLESAGAAVRALQLGSCEVCCNGLCCGPGECCSADGMCQPCAGDCTIDGAGYATGAVNPDNECEWCDPVLDPFAWSRRSDEPCGDGQVCCGGVCCRPRWCCRPDGVCDIEFCGLIDPCEDLNPCGCTIGDVFFPNNALNPANECQKCNVAFSTTDWTPTGILCGSDDHQFCCNGVCCEMGACCNESGVCQFEGSVLCEGCMIDGHFYFENELNPANPTCQACARDFSATEWTTICRDDCCATLPCGHCP